MARSRGPVKQRAQLAWLISAPLAGVAFLTTMLLAANQDRPVGEWSAGLLVFGLFVLAGFTVLRFEVGRHAFGINVTEIPLLLGFFFLPPVTLILARMGALLVTQRGRRLPATKFFFNIAVNTAATAMGCALVVSADAGAAGEMVPADLRTWLVLGTAVEVTVVISLCAVIGVISLVQGRVSSVEILQAGIPALTAGLINIAVGLVVLIVLQESRWSLLLLAVLVAFFMVAYRSYANAVRQHRTLTEMYSLTRAVADAPHDGTLADVLLRRVRELLQAEFATLWLPAHGRYPEVLLSARVDDRGLLDLPGTPDALRKYVMRTGETVAIGAKLANGADAQLRVELSAWGAKDAIVVPLRAGSAVIGCLEVANRLGDITHFRQADAQLLEAVAAHAAVAVENSRLVDRLRFDAYHDALTGLANRRRLTSALEESVGVRAPGEVVAVLMFDVDGMRDVNDSLGHASGDKLLAEVARRLRTLAPPAALVGRSGGDEFVVTLRTRDTDVALRLAADLREQLQNPMVLGTLTLDVDTAVGVSIHPDHGGDSATLLQRADVATQSAKQVAARVQLFHHGLESRSVRRLGLAGDLRRALEADELEVYFQPKVSLAERRLVGVECLARWEHPVHGSVAPEDFVVVAEHTGQLGRLTEAVLAEGLRRCRQWHDSGRPLSVAVNLSVRTLVDPGFPKLVERLLAEHGVAAERLTFEISETGVGAGLERPGPTLHRLRDMGVRISVDDFGSGSSSLSYLRRLPVQEVKIDRSFVQGMATDAGDLAIVRAVVDLARHFQLTAVAEGVESELTLGLLEEMGCDLGQGFLFSRPLPYERLEAWVAAQTEVEPTSLGDVRRLRAVH